MLFYKKDDVAEEKIAKMKEKSERKIFDDGYIRNLVGEQKGELNVPSKYYKGNIAEGNWSILKDDSDIEKIDKDIIDEETSKTKIVDCWDVIFGATEELREEDTKEIREKDAEYQYVFIPSYYAVKILILYYLENKKDAEKIYSLKNAVVRRDSKKDEKFYGGLPFILKYIRKIYVKKVSKDDSIKFDFADVMQKLLDYKSGLEINNIKDEFINDIIDCIKKAHCGDFIVDKRIKDFKDSKEEFYCINFKEELEKDDELLNFELVDDYKILMHRDVKKDWNHLKKEQIKEVNKKIRKTPKHPNNDSIKDSEKLKADLSGWFSQDISKKDRLVYRKEKKEKVVYIATVCDHYKDAARRTKSTSAYK